MVVKRMLLVLAIAAAAAVAVAAYLTRSRDRHAFTFPAVLTPAASGAAAATATESSPTGDDWPQWRGAGRDAISGATGLLDRWPAGGPPLLWTASGLGRGMSSVSIAGGAIFTLGRREEGVCLVCLSTDDGTQQWVAEIGAGGDPNGTPTVDGEHVFAISREGRVVCVARASGDILWTRDFVAEFQATIPTWGYGESPLVESERVVCTPGAQDALMVALDRATGKTIWKTAVPDEMRGKGHPGAGYSSAVASDAGGVRQYVQMFGGGLVGIAAADGSKLWGYNRIANSTAVIPTPIISGDYVFASSGYGAGAALLRLQRSAAGLEPVEVYFHRGNTVQNHHGGMVLLDGHVYLGHGHNRGMPLCMELLTGQIKWGPERGVGTGSAAVAFADGHLYFRYEDARMALIEATPAGYHLKSEFRIPSRLDRSWPHPAIAGQRLYLRDQDVLLCYDLAR